MPSDAFPLGLADDGVAWNVAWFRPARGNLAVVGQRGRGVRTLLANIERYARGHDLPVRVVADADELLDPLATSGEAARLRRDLADPSRCTVFALRSGRRLRVPEHCATRVVFPTGERTVDLADGVPADLLRSLGADGARTPGRAVLVDGASATLLQCAAPPGP
ncbi:MAG: hypothetical protein UHD09_01940 [Bifidobacterium sp.]|nr:hypothetical protein [Bifidobacterium sp.]